MTSSSTKPFRVYGRTSSINTQKVLFVMEECQQTFTLHHASKWLGPGQNRYDDDVKNPDPLTNTPQYLAMTPTGLIPTLECHDAPNGAIFESSAIIRYIARISNSLHLLGGPSAEGQAVVDQMVSLLASRRFPAKIIIDNVARLSPEERSREELVNAFAFTAEIFSIVDQILCNNKTTYLAGNEMTVADIIFSSCVCRWKVAETEAKITSEERSKIKNTPGIDAWFDNICKRPSFIRGMMNPERMHQGLSPTEILPDWHQMYLSSNNSKRSSSSL